MAMVRPGSVTAIETAVQDLENRTLADLRGGLTKLVYLSSTRDYNTGEYQHAGLSDRFGSETAARALARCHEAAFQELVYASLAELVNELALYIESTGAEREKVLDGWRRLQAYRVLIPGACDDLSARFFVSNLKIALEALAIAPPAAPAH